MDTPIRYRDFWFKIGGSLVISQIIDSIGRQESYLERFKAQYFYIDMLGGFLIALILWEAVRLVIRFLDKKYDWIERPLTRVPMQIILGIITPAFLSFLFTLIFMKLAHNQDIYKTSWIHSEFYTVVLSIVLINLIYFTWYLYIKWNRQGQFIAGQSLMKNTRTGSPVQGSSRQAVIEISKAGKTILLPQQEMACAFLNDGYCYIKKVGGEGFLTTYTLDELTKMVDENAFFRVNRQILVSRHSCISYMSIDNGKIEIELDPPLKTPVIVSQKRASEFRKWISSGNNDL